MDKKIEEMIALGAAYALNCQSCMEVHKKKAVEAGLTEKQMQDAIRIAEAIKTGAHGKSRKFADDLFGKINEAEGRTDAGQCCAA